MDTENKNVNVNKNTETGSSAAGKLMQGATILAIAGIMCKILGGIFRIPLTNMIGAEGQSYYGAAYPVYQLFYTIATAGFPVAISRMVSERVAKNDYINADKSYRIAMQTSVVVSIIAFAICCFGADQIADFVGNPGAAASIRAISIALLFTPFAASLRGYFQGLQIMTPSAVSQVAEQFVRVCAGLILAYMFFRTNLEYAAAGATFGASAGMIAAMIVLYIMYYRFRHQRRENAAQSAVIEETTRDRFRELVEIVIPITIGSSIMPLMMTIDLAVIMRRLQATGWSLSMSKTLYGLISGYCDPLVNLPVIFIDAITISLIPAVTRAFTLKIKSDLDGNIMTGLKTMMIIAYPCAVGLIVLAGPILHLLYPTKPDEAEMAIHTLQILSLGIVTLSVMRTLSASLQGIGKMTLPVINLGIGAVIKIIATYVLVGIPALNVNGAAIGTVIAYLTAALLNYRGLRKHADVDLDLGNIFIRPLWASLIMGAGAIGMYKLIFMLHPSNLIASGIAIIFAVIVYFVMVFVTGAVSREELALVPKGETLYNIAVRMHLAK
ncbi:MAG: polysaccharide biosynthesis protein [Mogibacterium sp.]|nr:polysaccharide biosynthesis protein [Mogibacterium sp.]